MNTKLAAIIFAVLFVAAAVSLVLCSTGDAPEYFNPNEVPTE